jgi:cytochrome c-type biogenesis protein CcsB
VDSVEVQIILYWISVGFYVVSTIFFISSLIFNKERLVNPAVLLTFVGFLFTTAAIIMRWVQLGRFPYWGTFEVFATYAWVSVAFYLIVQFFRPNLKITGALVLPLSFIMIGIAVMSSADAVKEIPRTFYTYWLGIHITFAQLSYAAAIISAGMGLLYIIKEQMERNRQVNPLVAKLPDLNRIDYFCYRFAVFAFIMLMIMMASGSIWAFKAWGRYWGWDPIETWALISWLVYGLYLHLRITYVWKGKRSAWLSVICLLLVLFSYFGIPLFYPSVHEHLDY